MSAEKITLEIENNEGDLVELVLPTKFEVCPRCRGTGRTGETRPPRGEGLRVLDPRAGSPSGFENPARLSAAS